MSETLKIKLHRFQDEAIFAPERFVAIISGLQGGKTVSGALWSRIRFDESPDSDGMIGAPTYKILEQSTLPKFFQLNPDLKAHYKKGDQLIEVPGRKGRIYIRSLEDPNSIEGMTLKWIWLDEAGQMKVDAWINAQGRVSIQRGRIFLTTTPYNMGWLYTDFFEHWKQGDSDYRVVQFRSVDSPYFPKEEFVRAQRTMDGRVFRRRYEGQFEKMEGLVYPDFNSSHVTDRLPEKFDHVIAGVDWGYEAPTAITVFGIKDGVFYLVDEFYQAHKTQQELEEIALRLKEQYGISRFYPDSAEQDRIEGFQRKGLYCVDVNKDIPWGIQKIQDLIRTERLKVHPRCVHFLDEIERYHYPEQVKGREVKENPVKGDDHCFSGDTLIHTVFGKRKIKDLVGKTGFLFSRDGLIKKFTNVRKTRCNAEMIRVEFESGETLSVTPDHLLLCVDGSWVEAGLLRPNDVIQSGMYAGSCHRQKEATFQWRGLLSLRTLFSEYFAQSAPFASSCLGVFQRQTAEGFPYSSLGSRSIKQSNREPSAEKGWGAFVRTYDAGASAHPGVVGEKNTASYEEVAWIKRGEGVAQVTWTEGNGTEGGFTERVRSLPYEIYNKTVRSLCSFLWFKLQNEGPTKTVKRIERGFSAVTYNLEVAEVHCLVAGGIVAHNSMDSARYALASYQGFVARPKKPIIMERYKQPGRVGF